ncbi:MAG: efflux RND transporter permease subunit, partial [Desulfurivibrionaceae bacterium]|nr:efflux RND transporter permease subunit [Desulfurivibrionaceae bacterium]
MNHTPDNQHGFAGRLASVFIESRLTIILIIASLLLGIVAVAMLPREEEPQIKVPMIDVMVAMPGATPKEVEERVSIPMEKLLYELPGVEYIYTTSMPGQCLLVARFYVGEKMEDAIVRLNQKLATNFDRIPHGVVPPLVKPHTIDDVPVLALTLHSPRYDHYTLRRLASQLDDAVKNIPEVAETKLIGGARRQVRVLFDPARLAARGLTATEIIPKLQQANLQSYSGTLQSLNTEILLQTGRFLTSAKEVGRIVVGVYNNRPVYLDEVAGVVDGPEDPTNYVLFGSGKGQPEEAAVTLSLAKRPGANAVQVVETVLAKIETLKGTLIPSDVTVSVTRNYGETAAEKSNELLLHMGIAVFGVTLLILFFLGWRESVIVILAIPSTLALTLLLFYLYGYTLNRITLFALIFSIGILVDDAIVVVENINRHCVLNRKNSLYRNILNAVDEVGNPTILATWTVIASILPMAFVSGMMGPYMRPIPIGASVAMLFSLGVAFAFAPWLYARVVRRWPVKHCENNKEGLLDRLYRRLMGKLIYTPANGKKFLLFTTGLLAAALAMVAFRLVIFKTLPFDNKNEFQVIINMPESSSLQRTQRAAGEMAKYLAGVPEVRDLQVYAGASAPYNFNGMVRHYFLRRESYQADIQVNLSDKH